MPNPTKLQVIPRISATKAASPGTMAQRIVLNPSLRPNEWVTHLQTLPDRGKHHGNYFEKYEEAYDDFLKRCIKLGVDPRDSKAEEEDQVDRLFNKPLSAYSATKGPL